jgi:hypothetical protein
MTVPGVGPTHRVLPMSTHPTANPRGRSPTSRASRAFCRSMALPAPVSWPIAVTSGLPSAGRTSGVTSTNSPPRSVADRERGARTYRSTLSRRERHPWPQCRRTPYRPVAKKPAPIPWPRADWRGTCLRYLKANLVRPILNLKFVAVTYMDYSVSHLTPRQF